MRPKKEIPESYLSAYSIPFQLQIRFTRTDGMKCLRLLTIPKKVTSDRKVAEKIVNVSVIGINSIQQAAKLALQGDTVSANKFLLSTQKFLEAVAITPAQQEELSIWKVDHYSELVTTLRSSINKKSKMEDTSAKILYKMKAVNFVPFLSAEKKRVVVANRKNHTLAKMAHE